MVYLVKLIQKNDSNLLNFKDDVRSVEKAENIMLDSLQGDLKQVVKELSRVKRASKEAGDKYRDEDGKLINPQMKKSLKELREQKTQIRMVSGVKFYNKMEHPIEHTPMEIFALQAEELVDEASSKIESTHGSFVAVLNYFGENDKMTTSAFFGTLKKFFNAFNAAKDHVERLEVIRVGPQKIIYCHIPVQFSNTFF